MDFKLRSVITKHFILIKKVKPSDLKWIKKLKKNIGKNF